MDDLKNAFGEPTIYKGIKFYPIRMKDCTEFYDAVRCLLYDKNQIQDVQIIKMSYLDFLFFLMKTNENGEVFASFGNLLQFVFREQKVDYSLSQTGQFLVHINDVIIDGIEFENVKKIIFKQNLIKYQDTQLDPELEQALKEAEEFMANKDGNPPTIEELVVSYHCLSGRSYDEIKELTIYQFNKGIERFNIIKSYETFSALMAENGASKDIQHFLCHIEEKGKYADVIMSQEEFSKMTSNNGIFKA